MGRGSACKGSARHMRKVRLKGCSILSACLRGISLTLSTLTACLAASPSLLLSFSLYAQSLSLALSLSLFQPLMLLCLLSFTSFLSAYHCLHCMIILQRKQQLIELAGLICQFNKYTIYVYTIYIYSIYLPPTISP